MEHTLTDKANYLSRQGHKVMFVTYASQEQPPAFPLDEHIRMADVNCRYFEAYRYSFFKRIWSLIKSKVKFRRKFREIISDFKPDIIDIATPNTIFFIPDIVKLGRAKIVIESHTPYHFNMVRPPIAERVIDWQNPVIKAIRKTDLLITLTIGDATCWRNLQVRNITTIPNPIHYPETNPDGRRRLDGRIICVGRLGREKRYDRMIDAFALIANRHSDWHIDIFGEGNEQQSLNRQIASRSLSGRVTIHPPTSAIYSEYFKSQFLVLSSDYEGFGLVIIEAMACGIPVVACNCPFGPSDIIEDGITGLLAKMEVKDLADKMEWMITHDKERKNMGLKARKAAARYKSDVVMKEWEQAYLSVIDNTHNITTSNRRFLTKFRRTMSDSVATQPVRNNCESNQTF